MKYRLGLLRAWFGATLFLAAPLHAQPPFVGNTLITPLRSTETFLIDLNHNILQTWHGNNGAGHTVYLLADNSVIRGQGDPAAPLNGGGGAGGHLQRVNSNDVVVWDYFFSNSEHQQHHDLQPMPNGNFLVIAWEDKTSAEAVAAGRTAPFGTRLLPTLIAELQPVGSNDANVVWEWRIWDHIIQDNDALKPNFGVIADHPELVDVDLGGAGLSWDHANFIDYNPERDEIVFSARAMNEVYVIDHSTTTAEAAGHTGGNRGRGGDILYRWGNPQNYGAGTAGDQVFWGVHGANWIDAGRPGAGGILAFNNGNRPETANDSSSVVEIQPPVDQNGDYILVLAQAYGPATPDWEYDDGLGFYSLRYGSAFRMPNGNTLICEGVEGFIFEINPDGTKVWTYIEPIGSGVFSADRYHEAPVPTLIADFQVEQRGGAVHVRWRLDASSDITELRLLAHGEQRTWPVPVSVEPGHHYRAIDNSVNLRPGTRVTYIIEARESDGWTPVALRTLALQATPFALRVLPAHPNPFNPATTLHFVLATPSVVEVAIYDVTGRPVRRLLNAVWYGAGQHAVAWDGNNDAGVGLPSATYYVRVSAGASVQTQRVTLLK